MILNHLRENPDAGDTLEGISKWWLNLKKIDVTVDEISSILETLVKNGKVNRHDIKRDSVYKSCKRV